MYNLQDIQMSLPMVKVYMLLHNLRKPIYSRLISMKMNDKVERVLNSHQHSGTTSFFNLKSLKLIAREKQAKMINLQMMTKMCSLVPRYLEEEEVPPAPGLTLKFLVKGKLLLIILCLLNENQYFDFLLIQTIYLR